MKNIRFLFVLAFCFLSQVYAQGQDISVFRAGDDGFKIFRIPAIIGLPSGGLLAFAEGRVNGGGDFGNIKIVTKKSLDGGKTWRKLSIAVSNDTLQAGNPSPVVDLTDPRYPKGRIFLFYNTGNVPETQIRKGLGLREVWYVTSTDEGKTWSPAVNITIQVHRPKQPAVGRQYNFLEDWRSYANGPGHAVQFPAGQFKGRIYVAANHSAGTPLPHYADGRAHGFYTDDHGTTFHLSDDISTPGGNESMAVVLSGDQLMINARNQLGNIRQRIVAVSNNGGQTWNQTYFDPQLPDPVCQGSILAIGKNKGKTVLAFCNAADTVGRDNLTVRISYDEGKTWSFGQTVAKAPAGYKGDFSAYSDLVKLSPQKIGVLYEKDNYRQIAFRQIDWK
jgi:sialidase-1